MPFSFLNAMLLAVFAVILVLPVYRIAEAFGSKVQRRGDAGFVG
ncbi:hypothetical protein [Teichococcus vastitatis]|jgi:hypothetical protein|nr:hypothetical protein [Pseudoroseomonas vastitatis]